MGWLLTPEKICKLDCGDESCRFPHDKEKGGCRGKFINEKVAKAQLHDTAVKLMEPCTEHPMLELVNGLINCEACSEFTGHDCGFSEEASRRGWGWHDLYPVNCSQFNYIKKFSYHRKDCPSCLKELLEECR